jgi:hypothetical protein
MSWTKTAALSASLFAGAALGAFLALSPRPAQAQNRTENILLVPTSGLRMIDENGTPVGLMGRTPSGAFLRLYGPNGPALNIQGGADSVIEAGGSTGGVRLTGGAQSGILVSGTGGRLNLSANAQGSSLAVSGAGQEVGLEASSSGAKLAGNGAGGGFAMALSGAGGYLELKSGSALFRAQPDRLEMQNSGSTVWSAPNQTPPSGAADSNGESLVDFVRRGAQQSLPIQ